MNKHERDVHGSRKNKFVKHILGKEKYPNVMKMEKNVAHESNLCADCGFTTTIKRYFLNHKCVHEEVKYLCGQCSHQASTKGNLAQHKRALHEGVKYPCGQCGHQASSKGDLGGQ